MILRTSAQVPSSSRKWSWNNQCQSYQPWLNGRATCWSSNGRWVCRCSWNDAKEQHADPVLVDVDEFVDPVEMILKSSPYQNVVIVKHGTDLLSYLLLVHEWKLSKMSCHLWKRIFFGSWWRCLQMWSHFVSNGFYYKNG